MLVLGDSLSAGYGMATGQGWVELLQQRLHSVGNNNTVVNASISGTTTGATRSRLDGLLQRHQPDHCIIELGANDGLRGLSLKLIERNLDALINGCRQQGATVLLLGMRLPPNYGPRYTEGFAAIYQKLADQHQIALLPFFLDGIAQNPELMQADQLHPTAAAQPVLLEKVWPLLDNTGSTGDHALPASASPSPSTSP